MAKSVGAFNLDNEISPQELEEFRKQKGDF
jgi:hypothetical protein